MIKFEVYTDGAVSGNPGGPGGAAALIDSNIMIKKHLITEYAQDTTNQRMEITGMLIALKYIANDLMNAELGLLDSFGNEINIYSDSAYCVNTFNLGWIDNWQSNGWKNSKKQPVANQDLWEEMLKYMSIIHDKHLYNINFIKVKGHANNELNNLVDEYAVKSKINQVKYNMYFNKEDTKILEELL